MILKLETEMDGEIEVKEEVMKKDLSNYEIEAYSNTMWQFRSLIFRTLDKYANVELGRIEDEMRRIKSCGYKGVGNEGKWHEMVYVARATRPCDMLLLITKTISDIKKGLLIEPKVISTIHQLD